MKTLVIPDVHLKPWLFDRAMRILKDKKAETAVCLMDIADDRYMGNRVDLYEETYERAVQFAQAHPDTLWRWGNHDISYLWDRPESGYSPAAKRTVVKMIGELQNALKSPSQIAFIHRIDNVLFSHGGLSARFVRRLGGKLTEAGIDKVLAAVNSAPQDLLWEDGSPLWLRPQAGGTEMFGSETFIQAIGHTPSESIYEENGVIYADVFSTASDGEQIGEAAMPVIDTLTKAYEIIAVEGKPRKLPSDWDMLGPARRRHKKRPGFMR
ncbi:metallophosphoesterase [bacterium]|nr:metallophosphoesterase [bacterium]